MTIRQSLTAFALAATILVPSAALALSAAFTWKGIGACGGTSPAFALRAVPKGTASLRFAMRNLDAPNFRHGGSTVAYDGKGHVAQGAISYVGPCPPPGQTHRYVWTVEALDGAGSLLGQAEAQGSFPPR